jgi:hypothetical protein
MKITQLTICLVCFITMLFSCKKDKDGNLPNAPNPPALSLNNEIIVTKLGSDFIMEADLADSVGLKSFTVRYDDWFLYNVVSLQDSGYPKAYHVKYRFRMPDTAANKIHSISITATNVGGKETSGQYKVSLNTDFTKMYLIENTDASKLTNDLFGVPTLINKTASNTFEAVYYSKAANSQVWFIPSKTALKPIMYGVDPADALKFTGDFAAAKPVVLPAVGYYRIVFNTLTLAYTVTLLPTPSAASAVPQVAIAGVGFYDYPNMNWQNTLPNIILLDKDPVNPYIFTKTVRLGNPTGQSYRVAQFIFTTNNGWDKFWRFDNGADPEFTVPDGGNTGGDWPITGTPVSYKITFDTYINRCKLERQ